MSFPIVSSPSRTRALLRGLWLGALLLMAPAWAAPPVNTLKPGLFGGRGDLAIQGYDAVAYFTDGKPVPGRPEYEFPWQGARWRFASAEHQRLFAADPARWAPQYGGYCAYGVANDHLVKIDPEAFSIVDGKLYLNYDADVQKSWLADPKGYIATADRKFAGLLAH